MSSEDDEEMMEKTEEEEEKDENEPVTELSGEKTDPPEGEVAVAAMEEDGDGGNEDDNNEALDTEEAEQAESSSSPPTPAAATAPTTKSSSKKRPRSPETEQQVTAAVSAASAAAAAQLAATMGWNGLYSLLSATAMTTSSSAAPASMPTVEQVQQAAQKSVSECPPFVHLSKTDSAPQLKFVPSQSSANDGDPYPRRLTIKGGMRGYRMSRATHGISSGNYYYEVLILDPPPVSEIVQALPSNVRMGQKLQEQMQKALQDEKEGKANSTFFGGHVRLGFSMRTGDLQAPVGYDKWSFAIRDIGGSKIHCSKREDNWGGEAFGPGDVVGCAISLPPKDEEHSNTNKEDYDQDGPSSSSGRSQNHIRFFKNGSPMGQFIVSKGKREGGVAFTVPDGVYYPAISLYMGAAVQVNFGPHFIYPPKKLPHGLKLQPVSDLCKAPITIEDAIARVQKEKAFRKPEMLQKFQDLVQAEVQALQDAYQNHRRKHTQEVAQEREKRNLKIDDLEEDEFYGKKVES